MLVNAEDRQDAMEGVSSTTEAPLTLNRSYDTALQGSGRRVRLAARSSGKGTRVRPVLFTSSVPSSDEARQTTTSVPVQDQSNDTADSLARRPRRRRPVQDNATEKDASLTAETSLTSSEPLQSTLDDDTQPTTTGSFATPADSNLLDIGSPRTTETVKTKKRMRKKSRGSSEALSVSAEFEPDPSVSKGFSPSFQMRTSSPVEEMFSFKPDSQAPDTAAETKASETERDANLWSMFDTPLNDLCKRLLAEQNFDKSYPDDRGRSENLATEADRMKFPPTVDDLRKAELMEVDVEDQAQPETTTELPLKIQKGESDIGTSALPLQLSSTALPTTDERPVRRKHTRHVEHTPAAQPTENKDSTIGEDRSQSLTEPVIMDNENVPNVPVTETRADSRPGEDLPKFSMELDAVENRNVANVLSLREKEAGKNRNIKMAAESAENYENSRLAEDRSMEPSAMENRNVPNLLSVREPAVDENKTHYANVSAETRNTTANKNVPNVLYLREAEKYEHKKKTVPADQPTKENGVPSEGSVISEKDSTTNRNVPNFPSFVELSSEPELSELAEPEKVKGKEILDIVLSSPTLETLTQTTDKKMQSRDDDDDDDTAATDEMDRLRREQRQLIEEEELRQEQKQRETLERQEQERREQEEILKQQERKQEREKTERREKRRQEKEEKERRKREKKKKKELKKQQADMLADGELSAKQRDEPRQPETDNKTSDYVGSPTVPMQDFGYTKETAEIKIEEPREVLQPDNLSRTRPNVNAKSPTVFDRYTDIPMVDDVVDDEEIIPPADDHAHRELTPNVEKSARRKPPSGRKMPPRSPLFPPAPVPKPPEDGSTPGTDTLTYFRSSTTPRTTLKEAKARDRELSARQRSRSADRSLPHDRTGSHLSYVDIDIESAPSDSVPASLSTSFDAGMQPFTAGSPLPLPDHLTRRSLRPARSEEMLFVKKLTSRSPTPSFDSNDSRLSTGDTGSGGQWMRTAKSTDCLNRSLAGSEFSGEGLGRRSLSREWQVVTTTTKEEIVFVKRSGEDTEERGRIKAEYEKNKQVREMNEQRLTKEREKIERERLERLLAELRRRRQKERQQLLEKKMAEKKAKEENDRFIREAVEQQRKKRLAEDKARREEEQKKRDELNEKWQKEKEQRENLAKEKQEQMKRERQEKQREIEQLQTQIEKNKRREREEQERRKKELHEKRENEEKERRERDREQERQRREKLAREEKLKLEEMDREAKLMHEKMEKERMEKETKPREEEIERLEKEREMMEKLAEEHRLKLEELEKEKQLYHKQLEKKQKAKPIFSDKVDEDKLQQDETTGEGGKRPEEKQRETTEKDLVKSGNLVDENRELKRECLEKEETLKRIEEENKKLEHERREREALEKIIQEQKLRLEILERQEKLTEEQTENERGDVSAEKESDKVFVDQPSTSSLLSPSSPMRPRLPSREIATQTDGGSPPPATMVGQVRHYPATVVTERLMSDSDSAASSPVSNIDDPTATGTTLSRPELEPFRRRAKSMPLGDRDDRDADAATPVIVHEYSELLSFWRGDPTDGRLTRARAKSLRTDAAGQATVRNFDLAPEQWSSSRVDSQPPAREDQNSRSENAGPTPNINDESARRHDDRRYDDHDNRQPASAPADEHGVGEKTVVHSTLGYIG